MRIPEPLLEVLRAVRRIGRPRLVGGCVRDWLLGLEPKDFDVEVPGTNFDELQRVLAPFGSTDLVGRSFGVIKLRLEGVEYDFSLPRRESKTGAGHRGFRIDADANITDAEAAARRDFTINAIAYDPFADTLIDPHDGRRDLERRVLRHTSSAFSEDPLRVLRAFQFAARFDLTLAPETAALSRSIADAYRELAVERVWGEWAKWAEKSTRPSRGLLVLEDCGWLVHFPEVAALRGTLQDPEWHPEGDVFTHTLHCCDAMVRLPEWQHAEPARKRLLLLAILAHDFGKPATTVFGERRGRQRWISPGHESAGGPLSETFLTRIGAPRELIERVRPLVVLHLAHHSGQGEFSDQRIRRLARKLAPATIEELCLVMRADHDGRPPLHSPETLGRIEELNTRSASLALARTAPRPLLLGRHLITLGQSPGPDFRKVLDLAFEAQLDGAFADEAGAMAWAKNHLPAPPHRA